MNDTVFENHEQKYSRLFPLLVHRATLQMGADKQPTKFESLPTFSGYQDHSGTAEMTGEEFDIDETRDENMSTNVYLKNKIEQGFKRVVTQNNIQQLKPRSTKEQYDGHHNRVEAVRKAEAKSLKAAPLRGKYD